MQSACTEAAARQDVLYLRYTHFWAHNYRSSPNMESEVLFMAEIDIVMIDQCKLHYEVIELRAHKVRNDPSY